jgi:hypothetical protein
MGRIGSFVLAVVAAAALLVAGAAPAAASDDGLRRLVVKNERAEHRFEARVRQIPKKANSLEQAMRQVGRTRSAFLTLRRDFRTDRRKFAAEAAETPQAAQGRELILRALKQQSALMRRIANVLERYRRGLRQARSVAQLRRAGRRYDREWKALSDPMQRSDKTLKRGRKLIRTAPPVAAAPAG